MSAEVASAGGLLFVLAFWLPVWTDPKGKFPLPVLFLSFGVFIWIWWLSIFGVWILLGWLGSS